MAGGVRLPPGRVTRLREARAWTIKTLSQICSVSVKTIQRVENSHSTSKETALALAQAFDIELIELLSDSRAAEKTMDVNDVAIQYIENEVHPTDGYVIVYLHGIGLDQEDFWDAMDCGHHAIAPTLYGYHPYHLSDEPRSLDWHVDTIAKFLDKFIGKNSDIRRIVLVGFSLGADIALKLLSERNRHRLPIAGVLAFDCNLNRKTLFISSHLATMCDPSSTVAAITRIAGADAADVDTALARNYYVYRVFGKLRCALGPLQRLAADINALFADNGYEPFLITYARATASAPVKIVLSDAESNAAFLRHVQSRDATADLGRAYEKGLIERLGGCHHFDLMNSKRIVEQTKSFVQRLSSAADHGPHHPTQPK